jgi:hypothetical protein
LFFARKSFLNSRVGITLYQKKNNHASQASDPVGPGFRHFLILLKYIQWRIRWMMSRAEYARLQ